MEEAIYYHKTVPFRAGPRGLLFRTSQELFSSHDIDIGTKFLLRTIMEGGYGDFRNILDMGCGYGPLGLALKSLYPDSAAHLVDRDALAVAYARQNAALNKLDGVEIYGSLGYDDVARRDFDLVVANIPGKAGENVIAYLLREAPYFLKPGGLAAAVVVAPLAELVDKTLAETPGAEIILKRDRPGHAVFHYRFSGENAPPPPSLTAFERGIYHRRKVAIRLGDMDCTVQTAHGLPEFDSLSYASEMLVKTLPDLPGRDGRRAVVFNPGQGHVALALWRLLHPRTISLVDRDLLALRYSRLNLVANGCPPENIFIRHQAGIGLDAAETPDLFLGVLREAEGRDAITQDLDHMAARLRPGGLIVLAAGSTAVTRLVSYAASRPDLRVRARERRRGFSLLVLEKT